MQISLGKLTRDKVTGFTGIAMSRTDFATGNVQFTLQPPVKDGAMVDPISFDQHQLEVVPGSASMAAVTPELNATALLGKKLRCIATGMEGIAVRATTFLNGCVYYTIYGKVNAKGEFPELFLDSLRAEVVSAGIQKKIASKQALKPGVPTGGPVFRNPARG